MRIPNLGGGRQVTDAGGSATDTYWMFFDAVQRWIAGSGVVVYGTSAQRTTPGTRGYFDLKTVTPGSLFVETDTGKVYQVRSDQWFDLNLLTGSGLTQNGAIPKISVTAIASATAANPAVLTSAAAHGLVTGNLVTLGGATGTWTPLNATWTVTVISPTRFSVPLDSSAFGAFTGTVVSPATLRMGALVDNGVDVSLTAAIPVFRAAATGGSQPMRLGASTDGNSFWSQNLSYNGANWLFDNTAADGILLHLSEFGVTVYFAARGPNPASLVQQARLDVFGNVDLPAAGVYKIDGTQVLGPQLAGVAGPAITTTNTGSTAGATYTAVEQGMLNTMKSAIGFLNTDVTNLQTAVNALIARLQTTGITA